MSSRFHKSSIKSFLTDGVLVMVLISAATVLMVWSWRTQSDLTIGETVDGMNIAWTNAMTAHSALTAKEIEKMSKESLAKDKPASWTDADYLLAGCLLDKARGKVHDLRYEFACDLVLNQNGVRVERVPIVRRDMTDINQWLLRMAADTSNTTLSGKR